MHLLPGQSDAPLVSFPDEPVLLIAQPQNGTKEAELTSLRTLLESRCPSIFKKFKAWKFLFKYADLSPGMINL